MPTVTLSPGQILKLCDVDLSGKAITTVVMMLSHPLAAVKTSV